MRAILATILVVVVLGGAPVRAEAPVLAGKVFSGPEGEQVAVIPLAPSESRKFLLHLQGTGSELDGKVLPHEQTGGGDSAGYTTELRGRKYTSLSVRTSKGKRRHLLYVPGRRDGIEVSYDDERTRALKADDVYALHQKQRTDGTLSRLMDFDRKAEQAGQDEAFATSVKSLDEACGTSVSAEIDWSSVSDELLKGYSISSYCESPLSSLERLCASAEAKKAIQAQVKAFTCRFGETLKLEVHEGRVGWTTSKDEANQEEFATRYFEENLESSRGQGEKLAEALRLEKTRVCTDGKGHYVVVAPHERQSVQLSYGDGSRFVQVATPPWVLSGHYFLEPRFFNKTMNASFRGVDMRVYSEVDLDKEKNTCAVRCGERSIAFSLLESEPARELLRKATFEPNPQKYVPYALLRDSKGRYYYVDRGFHPSEEKSFRVFLGLKGSLRQQKMTDLVSDSEGEVFSTKKGDLRLVVDREAPSHWLEGKKKTELRQVPISENLPLIYNELGVYTGERLGTPCDDQ